MTEKMKSTIIWTVVVAGVIGMVALLAIFGNSGSGGVGHLTRELSVSEHLEGNFGAPLQLVEYSDFQCPACGDTYPLIKRLVQDLPDELVFAYRHFPLRQIHSNANRAAEAAEAAGKQGKFWEMHDMLFNTQEQWSTMDDPSDFFVKLANSIGLEENKFVNDLNSADVADKVDNDYNEATALELQGTPSFYLNGEYLETPGTYDGFKSLLEQHLSTL
ncbi:MAG: disulfide bond formation protein DsbA [Candidatus Magasanikbacteria bacterium CG_4_10_14_0_2_um_filter_37_12]|uniref:Disulfide bond formation protein DsbA n=1 Tax=Candidatus Magasanikbacteria bacterium CG_4_10_14_0_2_um_filter_37_12 TaxID=1974637 RepID=A0A2M7V7A8_9BACT|nr:MAG: disulfide bond formation protein DsbA [Candidatus Magasanikbacteria bacterium CG_4_10_14_0_2_um_filter_37_12]